MKHKPGTLRRAHDPNLGPIRTTIMELLHVLSDLTKDDKLVLSTFKSIFDSHNVRLAHSLVPVRLVCGKTANRATTGRRSEKRQAAWA
jgi:hypothetical protein